MIQLVIVEICAAVRQARMFGHSSGMRAFVQPVTFAMTACAITLFVTSFGTMSILLLQEVIVIDAFGLALTMRV